MRPQFITAAAVSGDSGEMLPPVGAGVHQTGGQISHTAPLNCAFFGAFPSNMNFEDELNESDVVFCFLSHFITLQKFPQLFRTEADSSCSADRGAFLKSPAASDASHLHPCDTGAGGGDEVCLSTEEVKLQFGTLGGEEEEILTGCRGPEGEEASHRAQEAPGGFTQQRRRRQEGEEASRSAALLLLFFDAAAGFLFCCSPRKKREAEGRWEA